MFIPEDEKLVEITKHIKKFIQPTINNSSTENHNRMKVSCHNIQSNKISQSTRLRLETECTNIKHFYGNMIIQP